MKITSKLTHVLIIRGNKIMPGVNTISDESLLEHPSIKARIKTGDLKVGKKDFDFANMHVSTLKKEIKEIFDIGLLEKIINDDARPSVIKAAEEQLKKLREED